MIKIKKLPHPIVSPLWHPGIPPSQVYSRILMITQREKLSKKPFFYRMATKDQGRQPDIIIKLEKGSKVVIFLKLKSK